MFLFSSATTINYLQMSHQLVNEDVYTSVWLQSVIISIYLIFFFFLPLHGACRILVPWPGIEYMIPVVEVQNLNHWTTKEVPSQWLFLKEGETWEGKEIEEAEEEKSQRAHGSGICMCVYVYVCVCELGKRHIQKTNIFSVAFSDNNILHLQQTLLCQQRSI